MSCVKSGMEWVLKIVFHSILEIFHIPSSITCHALLVAIQFITKKINFYVLVFEEFAFRKNFAYSVQEFKSSKVNYWF